MRPGAELGIAEGGMRSATRNKIGRDPQYLAWIRTLPCWLCENFHFDQRTRTEAAHVGRRGLSQKCPDREAIPLCTHHHRTGSASQHVLGKDFWTVWNVDRANIVSALNTYYHNSVLAQVRK
jgi:hypothetical protein